MAKEKKEKVKKEKLPKIKKEKKPKVKKPKKPRVKKPKKPKKEKKPMSKKKLIILIILFLLILGGAAAAGYYFMFYKEAPIEEERREPPMFDYFTLDSDQIESITNIVGYKVVADAYGKDIVFEPWNPDGEEEKKKDKKDEEATDDKAVSDEAAAEEVPEETTVTYVYKDIQTASADVKEYVTYLMDNIGFKEVYPFYIDNPAGYITLSKDSAAEGYSIQIDIDYTKDSYTFILEKFKKPEEKKKSKAKATISRTSALDIIKQTPIEVLGLDESLDNLVLMGDPGHSTVDGMDCYGVNVYKPLDNMTTRILGTYYVASDNETIYKYDVMKDTYTKLN